MSVDTADLRPIERELAAVDLDAPVAARDALLDSLTAVFPRDLLVFFKPVRIEGTRYYSHLAVRGRTPIVQPTLQRVPEHRMLATPTLDPRFPEPRKVNRFEAQVMAGGAIESCDLYDWFLGPMEIGSALRMLVYDGDEFVAWVGFYRSTGAEPFDAAHEEQANEVAEPLADALRKSVRGEELLLGDDEYCVFGPDGTLEFASSSLGRWLTDARLLRLSRRVRALESGANVATHVSFDGFDLRFSRLESGSSHCYHAHFSRPRYARRSPLHPLTPTQRAVAENAVTGASNREIADWMGISPETVKSHLQNIYERLFVANRVELAQLVVAREPDTKG